MVKKVVNTNTVNLEEVEGAPVPLWGIKKHSKNVTDPSSLVDDINSSVIKDELSSTLNSPVSAKTLELDLF